MTWPAGKGVKIVFHEQDQEGAKETFMWKPGREYLHDVFVKAGMSIADFHISYEQDGEVLQLEPRSLASKISWRSTVNIPTHASRPTESIWES